MNRNEVTTSAYAWLKALLPPLCLQLMRRIRGQRRRFRGDYPSWQTALDTATGYDTDEILRRVAIATRMVISGRAVCERDSVTLDHVEYAWPLLACLLQVALERGSLRVIDFGGALGSSWRQNRRYLDRLRIPISWKIVEQSNFVTLGRREFTDSTLGFCSSIEEAAAGGCDVVVFSASLCYVEEPSIYVSQAESAGAPYMIVDRLPVIAGSQDRIAVQVVPPVIYRASYPVRLFAKDTLLKTWLSRWKLIEQWECDLQPDEGSRSFGFFLERQ